MVTLAGTVGDANGDRVCAPPTAPLRIARRVLRHRAVLYSAAQQPFSALEETYTSALFGFGRLRRWLPVADLYPRDPIHSPSTVDGRA